MQNKLRPFSWTRQVVEISGEIPIKNGCFAILVTNIAAVGGSQALVEGYPINAPLVANQNGESWTVGGIEGTEIKKETLEIIFPGATAGKVFVQQAFYTDLEF
jgi:hypothetical protein